MDYDALASKASALIARYGGDVVLTQTSLSATYSTLTHSYTKTTKSYSCKGVSVKNSKSVLPGSLAVGSDADFLLPASLTVAPVPNDTMTFGDVTHYIEKAIPLAPGGTTLLYKVWVKA